VLLENRAEVLPIFWAAQIAGLYYTPISTQFQRAEIGHILNDCDARVFITSNAQLTRLGTIDTLQDHVLNVDTSWPGAIATVPDTLISDAVEGAEMLYSSGTTGKPKGVRHSQPGAPLGTVSDLFKRRIDLHDFTRDTVYLSPAPLYHSAPLRYNAMTHRLGGTSVVMDHFDAEHALALIERHRVTHSQWVPTMFVRLLALPEAVKRRYDTSSLQYAIHAAAPCPTQIKHAMLDWWGPIIHEYYSGTEGNGQTAINTEDWLRHEGSVGRPILGKLHILDEADQPLPANVTGRIFFEGGPNFEYYKDPDKTRAARSRQGWTTLGDIPHLDDDGYLYLTDRASHMIITGGVNVYPREVEDVLVSHRAVVDAAVFGIPHPEFGEEVKAAVELVDAETASAQLADELISWCRERLAHLKCPKSIDFHDQLPRHATGKLYKGSLIAQYRNTPQ
jgi:acyl-CoA synthetase (AMP-forming)/AMP-acid ligase II